MSRSTVVPAFIVCLGLTFAAVVMNAQDAAEPAPAATQSTAPTAADFQAIKQRVEKLERQFSARREQEQLGRGFLAFEHIVANLDEKELRRYIRINLVLAVEDGQKQAATDALSQFRPNVKDWLIATLSGKSLEDVRGQDNQQKLRTELQAGINQQFKSAGYPEFAKAVLFDDMTVQ